MEICSVGYLGSVLGLSKLNQVADLAYMKEPRIVFLLP